MEICAWQLGYLRSPNSCFSRPSQQTLHYVHFACVRTQCYQMVLLGKKQNRRKFGGCADERAKFASWKCVFTEFTIENELFCRILSDDFRQSNKI
jgi:hypothetical protein